MHILHYPKVLGSPFPPQGHSSTVKFWNPCILISEVHRVLAFFKEDHNFPLSARIQTAGDCYSPSPCSTGTILVTLSSQTLGSSWPHPVTFLVVHKTYAQNSWGKSRSFPPQWHHHKAPMKCTENKNLTGFSGAMWDCNHQVYWAQLETHPHDQRSNSTTAALPCSGQLLIPTPFENVSFCSHHMPQALGAAAARNQGLGSHISHVIAGSLMDATWHHPCPTDITTWALVTFPIPSLLKWGPTHLDPSQGMVLADNWFSSLAILSKEKSSCFPLRLRRLTRASKRSVSCVKDRAIGHLVNISNSTVPTHKDHREP